MISTSSRRLATLSAILLSAVGSTRGPGSTDELILRTEQGIDAHFDYEVVHDPRIEENALFNRPLALAIAPDGRQFYLDEGDEAVIVLSSSNEHIHTFGSAGQGPGQWTSAVGIAVSPDNKVYVIDGVAHRFVVFDFDGNFLHFIAFPTSVQTSHVLFASSNRLFVGGLSIDAEYYGFFIHEWAIRRENRPHLEYVQSFAKVPKYTPSVYKTFARATICWDLDGGILFSRNAAYDLRKYDREGHEVWRVQRDDVFPDAMTTVDVDRATGQLKFRPFAASWSFIPINEKHYLHIVRFPPTELPENLELETMEAQIAAMQFERIIEFIRRDDPTRLRLNLRTKERLLLTNLDTEGRVYGVIDEFDPMLVRGKFSFTSARG